MFPSATAVIKFHWSISLKTVEPVWQQKYMFQFNTRSAAKLCKLSAAILSDVIAYTKVSKNNG